MREWLVFDVMGVIFTVGDDTNELLVPYVQKFAPSLTSDEINQAYLEASLGKVASCGFWKTLGLGERYPQIEQDYLESQLTLDADFPAVAQKLQKDYHLALLSNDVSEWSAYLRKKYDLNFEVKSFKQLPGLVAHLFGV